MTMLHVRWFDSGRSPRVQPNPSYPNGIDIDLAHGAMPRCSIRLIPYPTPRCGYFFISCSECGYSTIVTTAGRQDDPRSVTVPCQK
jgi:hypothetical protein